MEKMDSAGKGADDRAPTVGKGCGKWGGRFLLGRELRMGSDFLEGSPG